MGTSHYTIVLEGGTSYNLGTGETYVYKAMSKEIGVVVADERYYPQHDGVPSFSQHGAHGANL